MREPRQVRRRETLVCRPNQRGRAGKARFEEGAGHGRVAVPGLAEGRRRAVGGSWGRKRPIPTDGFGLRAQWGLRPHPGRAGSLDSNIALAMREPSTRTPCSPRRLRRHPRDEHSIAHSPSLGAARPRRHKRHRRPGTASRRTTSTNLAPSPNERATPDILILKIHKAPTPQRERPRRPPRRPRTSSLTVGAPADTATDCIRRSRILATPNLAPRLIGFAAAAGSMVQPTYGRTRTPRLRRTGTKEFSTKTASLRLQHPFSPPLPRQPLHPSASRHRRTAA